MTNAITQEIGKRRKLRAAQKRVQGTARLGAGARFNALEKSIAANPKVRNPGAVAAEIGRRKLGKARFQKLAARGRAQA